MENQLPSLPKPRLFTLTVIGQDDKVIGVKLQLVADENDLNMSIESCKEEFTEHKEVKTLEIEISYSPFCHDVFVTGLNNM